jgi:hypothetical protein
MSDRGLRVLRWPDVTAVARMMAGAYMQAPVPRAGPRTRATLTWLAAVAFFIDLAVYRPLVRYWIDPEDASRQTVVAITPHGRTIIPVRRLALGATVFFAVLLGLPALMPTPVLGLVVLALAGGPGLVVAVALLTSAVVRALPYEGKITRSGPTVPGTQLTASSAASTIGVGMLDVRAYLTAHHSGQRLTVRARDTRALALYRALGLEVVAPGCGRMTGVIVPPAAPPASTCSPPPPHSPSPRHA